MNDSSVDFQLKSQEAQFRVPYELLRKNIKDIQKLDEKQFRKMDELIKEFDKLEGDKKKSKLQQIINSMKLYEKKVQARYEVEQEMISRIRARINKLIELKKIKSLNDQDKLLNWYKDQTNLLIVDYLLRNNQDIDADNPGLLLLKELKFEKLIDYDIILNSNKISNSILINHDLLPLINWIQENKSYLKKTKSNLEFQTRFQEYIEFVKINELSQALKIFNTHLYQFTKSNFNEIKLGSGLLMIDIESFKSNINPHFKKYSNLLSNDRYKYLNDLFLEIYYKIYGIPQNDPLLIYLSIGISSLKTKSCKCSSNKVEDLNFENLLKKKMSSNNKSNNNCPVCSLELNDLSDQLPYSHNVKSSLFDNPVMLPNGNIFDKLRLIQFSKELNLDEKSVKDPITSEIFKTQDLVTMFPT